MKTFLLLLFCQIIGSSLSAQQYDNVFQTFIGEDCHLGVNDKDGKELLPAKYATIDIQPIGNEYLFSCRNKSQKSYFLFLNNKMQPLNYPIVQKINDRVLKVGEKDNFGMITTEGTGILLMNYSNILPAAPSSVFIIKNNKYGVFDIDRGAIVPTLFDDLIYWESKGYWCKTNASYHLVSHEGEELMEPEYKSVKVLSPSLPLCAVQKKEKWGLIDPQHNPITKFEYQSIELFDGNVIGLENEKGKWSLVNTSGEELTKKYFDKVSSAGKEGLIVQVGSSKGLLNLSGEYLLEPKYNEIQFLINDYVFLTTKEGGQIYDIKKKKLLEPVYNKVLMGDNTWNGMLVQQDRKWFWINMSLESISKAVYQRIIDYNRDYIVVEGKDKKVGLLDKNGQEILPIEYTVISTRNGFFKVQKEGSGWYYVDRNNQKIDCLVY